MKKTTAETLRNLADAIVATDIKSYAAFLPMVYNLNAIERKGEDSTEAMLAARNALIVLNIVRTLDQTFENAREAEDAHNRLMIVKKNASNLIYQLATSGADEILDRLLAYKAAKASLGIINNQYLPLLLASYDIQNVPVEAISGWIALNAQLIFLEQQMHSVIKRLETLLAAEASVSERSHDGVSDEIGARETNETTSHPNGRLSCSELLNLFTPD